MEFKIIDFNKVPGKSPYNNHFDALNRYEFNQILNYNKDVFFLLGDYSPENPDDKTSVIYSSLDFGTTFHKNTLGKGTISEGSFVGKDLYVILENRMYANGKNRVSSTLFCSQDFGKTWKEINHFSKKNIYGLIFFSSNIASAFFLSEDNMVEVKFTFDGGKNWKKTDIQDTSGTIMFTSSNTIQYINNNQLISFNINTNEKRIVNGKIANDGFTCDGYIIDEATNENYFYIIDNSTNNIILQNQKTLESMEIPKQYEEINIYNNLLYTIVKHGVYYDYIWSNDKGKTWQKEKMEDFFLVPRPIGYAENGYIYVFATLFKGSQEERGARLIIGHPKIKE